MESKRVFFVSPRYSPHFAIDRLIWFISAIGFNGLRIHCIQKTSRGGFKDVLELIPRILGEISWLVNLPPPNVPPPEIRPIRRLFIELFTASDLQVISLIHPSYFVSHQNQYFMTVHHLSRYHGIFSRYPRNATLQAFAVE